jgi:hypothetical protein
MADTWTPCQCAKELPARQFYEGVTGGWADGRLGQAYDLIDAVMRDQHPEHDSRAMCSKLLTDIESTDIEIGRPL